MKYTRGTNRNAREEGYSKSKKPVKILLLCLFMIFLSAAVVVGALLYTPSWKKDETVSALTGVGTESDPITISTVADLQSLATSVNGGTTYLGQYIVLENDLDLSGITWTPIGNATGKRFRGHFDGQNHTISNLYISQTAAGKGLFGFTTGATIENLTLYDPEIASAKGNYVGALVGYFDSATGYPGAVTNCHVLGGSIKSTGYYVGGLVGIARGRFNHSLMFENCTVKGIGYNKVPTEVMGAYYVGGLIGSSHCLNSESGTIYKVNADGSENAGIFVTLCATTANVMSTTAGAGGIIGWAGGVRVDQCYSTGAIATKSGGSAGGIAGFIGRTTVPGNSSETILAASKIMNCLVTGDITAASNVGGASAGGIVAGISIGTSYVQNCIFTGNVLTRSAYSTGNASAGGIFAITARATVYIGGCVVASRQVSGLSPGTYNISSPVGGGWVYISSGKSTFYYPNMIDGTTNYYNEDIMLSSRKALYATSSNKVSGNAVSLDTLKDFSTYLSLDWNFASDETGIWQMVSGTNDGFPYLRGLGIPEQPLGSRYNPILIETAADFKEMSANVNAGTNMYSSQHFLQTADLDLSGVGVTGTAWAKSFRGNYDGGEHRLLNVNITTAAANSAIFGYACNASFRNVIVENAKVYNTGSVSSVGILVGFAASNLYMENCAVIGGTLTAVKATNVGALCGYCNYDGNNFVKCFSSATVSGGTRTGGLIGYAYGVNVSRCYTSGTVTGSLSAGYSSGGLIGEITKPLGAYAYDESITTNTNSGCATPESTVTDCYSKCSVTDSHAGTGWAFAGGVIGRAVGAATVSNCYFNGTLSAVRSGSASSSNYGAFAGGIIGASYGTTAIHVKNCLSVMQLGTVTSTGKWLQVGYYNTYYSAVPAVSESCYYVETTFPTLKGGNTGINGGTQTTLEDVKAGSVFAANALEWDMDNIWSHDTQVNDGFPMLRGLIVDTSELVEILNRAKKYNQSDWNTTTYSVLARAISNAGRDLSGNITEKQKAQHIAALQTAIDGLRADKVELSSYYNKVIREISPNKEYYTNFSVVESLLKGAKEILDDNSNKYRNGDVKVVYDALQVAVGNLRIDKTELNKAIEEASALKAADYPKEAFDALQEELLKAVAVNNDTEATVAQVIEATENLKSALSKLQLDKTQIAQAIIDAYASIGVLAEYDQENNVIKITDETNRITADKFENYNPFGTALDNALRVQQDEKATSIEIQDAVFDLNVTLNSLSLNKKPLQEIYYKALSLNQDYYSEESFSKLAAPVQAADLALQLYASPDSFVEISKTLDEAYANLKAALDGLELNKTELEQLIKRAKEEEEDYRIYTTETWEKLQSVLADAETVYADREATQDQIHKAVVDLHDAIQNLDLSLEYLKGLIEQATKILNDETYQSFYLPETLDALKTARDNAQTLVDGESTEISAVKESARELQSALDALKADTEKLKGYIRRVLDENDENYIDPKVYAAESVSALRELAEDAQTMLNNVNGYTDEDVMAYTLRFEALFADLKPNKDALIQRVRDVSIWTNTKYRQDNDGKWVLDEDGNLKIFVIYELNSWNVLQAALGTANEVIINKNATVKEVADALAALEDAVVDLIVDTTELEERIRKAESLLSKQEQEEVYTSDSIANLREKYNAAKQLLANTAVKLTLDDVQNCLDELLAAIDGLKVDKENLFNLIEKAEGLLKYENYFTETSFSALKTQLNYVKENADDENLDENDISLLYRLLSDAIDGLEIMTDALEDLIDRYEKLEEQFVIKDSYELIEELATAAQTMLNKGEFSVEEYIKMLGDLTNAFETLKPDMDAFKAFIDECEENLNLSYTDESLETLQDKIDNALHIYNKEKWNEETGKYETVEITYDDVIDSVDDLRDAVNGLHPKKTALQELITATEEKMNTVIEDFGEDKKISQCYTAESYKILSEALDNGLSVLADSDATIEDVDKAIEQIESAIESLVVDKALLQDLIKECDEVYQEEYFEAESYAKFKTQLDKSKADVADENLSLEDFISSYSSLLKAKEELVFATDALEKIIALAETKQEADYSVASFKVLSEQLKAAKDYLNADVKDPEAYNGVCSSLLDAIGKLVFTADLLKEIAAVQTFVDKGNDLANGVYYSVGSFKAVEDLLHHANDLKDQPDPSQREVDGMTALLKDYESLLLDVTAAKQFSENEHEFMDENEGKYTAETWSSYTDAVAALDTLLAKDEVTLEELDEAMKAVIAAKEALTAAAEDPKNGLLEVIESNSTFKFIYGDGAELDFKTHTYDADNPVYLTNIALRDSLEDIIAQFENKENINAYDATGAEITDLTTEIATGMVLEIIKDGKVVDCVTLVVRGDVNGDGKINVQDKIQLNAFTGGTRELGVAYKLACDVNGDGKVNVQDKIFINAYTGGTRDIFDGLSVK